MNLASQDHEIARRILHGMNGDEVWLFGSRARGDHSAESDLDLLLLVPDSHEPRHVRSRRARGIVADIPRPMDVCVLTRNEWEKQVNIVNTLPFIARKEGRLLIKRDE
ncbi:MAG: nucleotidyltransferase domain-containing protein [Spartobacteria bacterium]